MKLQHILFVLSLVGLINTTAFATTHVFQCYSEEDSLLWTLKYDESQTTASFFVSDLSRLDKNGDYVTLFSRVVPSQAVYFETLDTKDPDGNPVLAAVQMNNGRAGYFEASLLEEVDEPNSYFITMDINGDLASTDGICSYYTQ